MEIKYIHEGKSPSEEEMKWALEHVKNNNLRVPLINFGIGKNAVYIIDEADFLISNYSDEDKRAFYYIAIAFHKRFSLPSEFMGILESFLNENDKRDYKLSDDFKDKLNSLSHAARKTKKDKD